MNVDQLVAVLPWIVVFVGMLAINWRLIGALDQALARTSPAPASLPVPQGLAPPQPSGTSPAPEHTSDSRNLAVQPSGRSPAPPPPVPAHPSLLEALSSLVSLLPKPSPAPAALPAPTPSPAGPFASAPPWFQVALHEIGFKETGNNQGLERYIAGAHAGAEGDPWCAIFANYCLETAHIPGTRNASSQSFRDDANFIKMAGPVLGAIVVFWRGNQSSGLGHVGFYRGEDAGNIWVLGGNENDMVQIEALPKSSASFGLIGYWWPKSVPVPSSGPVIMAAGSPIHVQVPPSGTDQPVVVAGVCTNITATMFGGPQSAYGGPIHDDQPGVALPFHFTGERSKVRVTNRSNGKTVDCDIVDVGPWNINDPYWEVAGKRPQAETGTDMTGRHTNNAGIDLTLAAAQAISLDGKGRVDWRFITSTNSPDPKVT